ncbi:hypothetical protein ACFQFS_14620 [Novosphingobium lubricantis]
MHDRLRKNTAVDLTFPVQLGLRENARSSSLQEEVILLLVVQVAHAIGVFDQIDIGICGVILGDAFQAVKEIPRVDLDEAVDADIADVGGVPIVAVSNVTMFLDVLTTGAIVPLVADLNGDELPFLTRGLEDLCDG